MTQAVSGIRRGQRRASGASRRRDTASEFATRDTSRRSTAPTDPEPTPPTPANASAADPQLQPRERVLRQPGPLADLLADRSSTRRILHLRSNLHADQPACLPFDPMNRTSVPTRQAFRPPRRSGLTLKRRRRPSFHPAPHDQVRVSGVGGERLPLSSREWTSDRWAQCRYDWAADERAVLRGTRGGPFGGGPHRRRARRCHVRRQSR
jgi:hypothetical protein